MTQIAVIGVVAISAGVMGYFVSRAIRRRLERSAAQAPFSLNDLRRMRDSGELTQAEYAAMRSSLFGLPTDGARSAERTAPPPESGRASAAKEPPT
ncbi:MAG: SHOCT domain-containing protein [Phycisphaerae bacterium]